MAMGPQAWRFSRRGTALRLFLTCWLVYALHFATNTVREIYPALSLGDHLSFDVSEYLGLHPDLFELPGRGAFANNNPGASILGAIPYALVRPAIDAITARVARARAETGNPPREYRGAYPLTREFYREARERGLDVKFGLAAGVMQTLLMAPLSALAAVVMFWLAAHLTGDLRRGLLLALLYAFATPIFYRTAQLNHNLLLAHCAFFSFALLYPWREGPIPGRRWLAAGLLAGWTVVLDYSGLIAVAALGAYALARWRGLAPSQRGIGGPVLFASGVAACAALLMAVQYACFGDPLHPAQHYMPQTRWSHRGYRGMDWPQPDLLWQTLFGMRFGLFTSAPFLLLALWVPGWLPARRRLLQARELAFGVAFALAFVVFCSANQFGRMQYNTGVRHVVPAVPYVFLLAAPVWLRLPRLAAAAVALAGTYWSWCLAMYRDVEFGLGVLEPLVRVSTGGPRLPWLTTLEAMGYVPIDFLAPLLMLLTAVPIVWMWRRPAPPSGASG